MVAKSDHAEHKSDTPKSSGGDEPKLSYWQLIKAAVADWLEDNAIRLAASLAFYTMLSLAPLLLLAIKAVGSIFGEDAARRQVNNYLTQLMGHRAASAVADMLGYKMSGGLVATIVSIVILLISASSVFGELQDSLNTIWEVKPKPGRAILNIIQERFFSFVLVLGTCFLLLVSLMATTVVASITRAFHSTSDGILWEIINFCVTLVVITGLFALIFKYLPDAKVRWRDVWFGAIVTGVLFTLGKIVLGWYLGRATTTSVYGAAGSLVAMLLWVYYSAQIFFFGAELTQAYASRTRRVKPAENAVPVTEQERAQQGMPDSKRVQALADAADQHAARSS